MGDSIMTYEERAMAEWEAERLPLRDAVVKETWGQWLSDTWDWDWFISLTFRGDYVGHSRANWLWRQWVKGIQKAAYEPVGWVRTTELQRYRGVPHYHGLMLNVGRLRRLTWLDHWARVAGWARVLPYDDGKGAAYYITKYVSKDLGEVVFSEGLEDFAKDANRPEQLEFLA